MAKHDVSSARDLSASSHPGTTAVAARGRCLCAATEFEISDLHAGCPAQLLVCNCSMCRRSSGALNVHWAAFPRDVVSFIQRGALKEYRTSAVATRFFCGNCGATVAMDYQEKHTIWLSVGLLGDDRRFTDFMLCSAERGTEVLRTLRYPSGHIFWESRCPLLGPTEAAAGFPQGEEFGFYVPDCAEVGGQDKPIWATADKDIIQRIGGGEGPPPSA